MQEELRIFLVDNAGPEVYDLMIRAFDIFEDMYPVDIHNKYLELVVTQDDRDSGETLALILDLTKFYLDRILVEHQITLSENTGFPNLIIIVEALLAIQEYEDTDTIKDILDLELDQEEKLSEILALVAPLDASELLIEIEEVGSALIDRLREYVTKETLVVNEVVELPEEAYLEEIRLFDEFSNHTPLIILDTLKSGVKVGYLFEIYLGLTGDIIDTLKPEEVARELLAMALVSIDGHSNPKSVISKHIEKYVTDMRKITQIDIKVTDLLLKYQKFKDQQNLTPRDI